MKSIFTTLFYLVCFVAASQETERSVTSQIKEVTIFLSGAQVTRNADVHVAPGVTTCLINGISPRIDEQSIQVETHPSVKLIAVSYRVNHLQSVKKSDQIQSLEKEKLRLQSLISEEKSMEEVYKEEEQMLQSNRQIGGQQNGVNVNDLKTAVDYFRTRSLEIKQKLISLRSRMAGYADEIAKVELQLTEMKNSKVQPTGEIVLKISAKGETKTPVKISYLVREAKWYPSYDVRAKDIKSPIGISYKANISQHSGEDWEKVTLTISSANPTRTGARPLLDPWYVGFNNSLAPRLGYQDATTFVATQNEVRGRITTAEEGAPLPGVNIVVKGTTVGTVTDVNGEYTLPLPSGAQALVFSFIGLQTQEIQIENRRAIDVSLQADVQQLSEVVVVGYGSYGESGGGSYYREPRVKKTIVATPVVRQTNVEYKIDEPYSIASDGEMRTVEMIEYEVDALYQYYCVPKLDKDAFLVARLINWDQYNFLEGEASLFFEGKYLGKSILDTRHTDDTLTLSLGRDKNVLVTREKVKDFSSTHFIGSNRKNVFAFEIVVRNKKQQEIEIRVEDHLPIPNTKEITVDKLEDSNAEHTETTGLLVWNKKILPGKTEKIDLKYAVKYPRYSTIILE